MNRRILLIDADPDFRAHLAQQLARYRFDLLVQPDADEAIADAATAPVALIILAAETDKAGFKTFGRIKKGPLAKTPIVLATRSLAPEDLAKHRAMRVHADDYIDKRDAADLLPMVDRLVGLGDLAEDLDIPVEIDDISMSGDDMVLEETVGEDDPSGRTIASPAHPVLDQLVSAETDAAFDALLGDFGGEPAAEKSEIHAPVVEPHDNGVPAPVTDGKLAPPEGHDDGEGFDTFSRESLVVPASARSAPVAQVSEPAIITNSPRFESSPAIMLDADDLMEEDSGGVPEPVPHPASQKDVEEAQSAPVLPRTQTGAGVRAVVDLGLDAIADETDSMEGSGVFDRRSLRKINDLERTIAQLKTELDRARATAESSGGRGSREREFVNLKSQLIAKDEEAKRARSELEARTREQADLEERLKQAQQAKLALETKTVELEQKLAADSSRASTLEGREKSLSVQVASLQQDVEQKTAALAGAESARAQLERDLGSERASRAATTSEAERALRVEREQMIARHQAEMGQLRQEHAGAVAMALEKSRQEHETALAAVRSEGVAAIEVARQQLDQARQEHQTEIEATRQQAAATTEALRGEHATAIDSMQRQHAGVLEQAHQGHTATLDAARREHGAVLEAAKREHGEAFEAAKREHGEALEAVHHEHAAALEAIHRDLGGQLAAAKQAHADAVAAAAQEHAAAMEAAKHELAAAVESTRQDIAGEADRAVSQLEAQHTADIAKLREELGERDARIAHLAAEHAATQEQYADALARAQQQAAAELQSVKAELANAQTAHDRTRAQLAADHARELEEQANQHAEAIAAREREWSTLRQDEAIAHTAALAEVKAELDKQVQHHGWKLDGVQKELAEAIAQHEQHKQALADDHERRASEQASAHAAALSALDQDRSKALEDAQRAQAEQRAAVERMTAAHRDELATQKDTADREIAEYRQALVGAKRALEEAAAQAKSEREGLDQAHDKALAELKAQHERAMAVANGEIIKVKAVGDAEHNRAMAAKDADHDRQRKETAAEHARVVTELTRDRDELQRGLSASRDTLKRSETELAAAVQTIADRNVELRTHAAAIAERDQRIADLRREIETLETENTGYQEQVLRAYQKIKADEAKSARAKKAMAIALTALDEEAAKTESS